MGLFSRNKPLIGLDIGSNSIKAVELTKSRKGYELTGFASEVLRSRTPLSTEPS
jgi:Tfp pilus assembly PilM family ATPase